MKDHSSEQGQALVLIMLAMIALLAFAALAIDGGWLYAERRRAQNAADNAAIAAAMEALTGTFSSPADKRNQIQAAVTGVLEANDYVPDGQKVQVVVNNPPVSGPYLGQNNYYQILITVQMEPIFSHFVYSGAEQLTVEAVTLAQPPQSVSGQNAIMALQQSGDAILWNGSVRVEVDGGNIYSNWDINKNGKGDIVVTDGKIIYRNACQDCNKGVTTPTPEKGVQFFPEQATPNCNIPAGTEDSSSKTLSPGKYADIKLTGGEWTMQPGFYCIGELSMSGQAELSGDGVMIVITGDGAKGQNALSLTGGGTVNLRRAVNVSDGGGAQWSGILFYILPGAKNDAKIEGNDSTLYSGTIYAPKNDCDIGGNSNVLGFNANLICNTIKFHGSTTVHITYDPHNNLQNSSYLEIAQ